MKNRINKVLWAISVYFVAVMMFILSPSLTIKSATQEDIDDVSFIAYKANVEGKTDYDYVNTADITISYENLPNSLDKTELMIQYVISDSETYTWTSDMAVNSAFNDKGVLSFDDTLLYGRNYIHSRMKLSGTNTIYVLAVEFVCIDTDRPTSGTVTATDYTFGEWTKEDVTIHIGDASDETSNIQSQTFKIIKDNVIFIDWREYEAANSEITLNETGVYTIYTASTDFAGNTGIEKEVVVKIDKEKPNVGELQSTATQYWNKDDVYVSILTGSENDLDILNIERSGFSHYQIELITRDEIDITSNYAFGTSYDGSALPFSDSGKYVLMIKAYDNVGNYHEYNYEFGIDKIAQKFKAEPSESLKSVKVSKVNVTPETLDGYSETKYYYVSGTYDVDTFNVDDAHLVENGFVSIQLNGHYTFASIDEVGNVYVVTMNITNIITEVTITYDGTLSQTLGNITPIKFTASIDVNASYNYVIWYVNGDTYQEGGQTITYTPAEQKGNYIVQAKILSDEDIVSNFYTISVSIVEATFIEIEYNADDIIRTYGNETSIILNAKVDDGASADSTIWYIGDSATNFGTGEAIEIPYTLIREVGSYKIAAKLTGSTELSDEITITVNPKEIIVIPNEGQYKQYGKEDPTLTYTLNQQLLYGDELSGSLSREEGNDVGQYLIKIGDLSHTNSLGNSNYIIKLSDAKEYYFTIIEFTLPVIVNHYGYCNQNEECKLLDTETVQVPNGQSYTAEVKEFTGYTYTGGSKTITVEEGKDNNISYYYTPNKFDITIYHVNSKSYNTLDQTYSVIIEEQVIRGASMDETITVQLLKDKEGYEALADGAPTYRTYTINNVDKAYYIEYTPIAIAVTVNHMGTNGKLLKKETIGSHFGLTLSIRYDSFNGYTTPMGVASWEITSLTNNVVNLSYEPQLFDVKVRYQNQSGQTIHEDTLIQGVPFDSTINITPLTINGYVPLIESANYTVTSILNNVYTFTYRATVKPVLTLIGDETIRINIDVNRVYTDEGAYANDNISVNKVIYGVWRNGNIPDYTKIGTFILDYNYINEDGLAAETITRMIIIFDSTAPNLNIGVKEETIQIGTEYDFMFGVTATDNYDASDKITITYETDLDTSLTGTYTITYTATDTSGNKTSDTKTIHVVNAKKAGSSFPIVPVIIGGALGVLGIIALIVFILIKKKKKDDTEVPEKKEQ